MRNILIFICVSVLVLDGVQGGATEKPTEKPIFKVSFGSKRHSDNVASASTVSAKTVVKANESPAKTKVQAPRDESLVAAESQSQPQQFVPSEDPRSQQQSQQSQQQQQHQVISESEYLALIQGSQHHHQQAEEDNGPPRQPIHHQQYHKLPSAAANTYYTKGHPLAGSSLEKEIEKLVSANQYGHHHPPTTALEQQNQVEPEASQAIVGQPQQHELHGAGIPPQRPLTHHHAQQPQQYRPPVVYKNGNDIVYIPYQQQLLHRDQYPSQRPIPGVTKAKIQYISANPAVRAPFPSEAIEYGPTAGNTHARVVTSSQFTPIKTSESFKELYHQQQQQNHLKRLQAQQQQQINRDNLNLHSHAQPQAIVYTSTSNNSPAGLKSQPPVEAFQPQPQALQGHPNIAQLAERLFKTPLDQQKPLSQAEFKALVAAGYPVQAVPVHTVVGSGKSAESAPQQHQFPQRYSPSSVSIPYPQPFSKEPQHLHQPQQQQVSSGRAVAPPQANPQPAHHHHPHRLYLQRPYPVQQPGVVVQNHHASPPQQYAEQKGQYTYVLQPGENEENAAEKLRQRIIQEINSQTHNGVANSGQVPPQITAGYAPQQIEYQPQQQATAQHQQSHHQQVSNSGQGQLPQQIPPQHQQGDPQKPFYKRLEYY